MPNLRKFFESMAEEGFYFNILAIPFATLLCVFDTSIKAPLFLLLFLFLLPYHYFLRAYERKLSFFLFLTWLPCILGLFTAHPIVYTLFAAMLCSRSVRRRTNEESRLKLNFETLCFPLVILAALHIGSVYLRVPQIKNFYHGQAIAVFLLAIVYAHLSGINRELELSSAATLQSTNVIANFAAKYVIVYIIGFFIVLALFKDVPFGNIILAISGFLLKIIASFLSLFKGLGNVTDGSAFRGNSQPDIIPDDTPPPVWATVLEKILIYGFNIFFLALIVLFVVFFCLRLYYGFYRKNRASAFHLDEVSSITPVKPVKKKKGIKEISDPIRRKFYKTVFKYVKKNKLSAADTPCEMKEKLKDRIEMTELTQKYEEVRYGSE